MNSLVKFSEEIRLVFEQNKDHIDLPFFYSFPVNSCESSACIHGVFLKDKFPNIKIEVLHGYNEDNDENHYWLEIDGLVFDITCDQFDGVSMPIYGYLTHPMSDYFNHVERFTIIDFVINYLDAVVDVEVFSRNKSNIKKWLGVNT
ncbi:hypothetical protein [Marinomonas foliarum]|uniref:Immunity protein 8 of polymorphic toxin system n=1 Tax=Marinomonas foliarum TaxID=491950 RepID=A0ABX7IP95_9GAMM|nr:hypothetical protein [Marinomonas foliarum]QRV23826.1 hypothetical protein JSY38_17715 [Marinomonas foliarum]